MLAFAGAVLLLIVPDASAQRGGGGGRGFGGGGRGFGGGYSSGFGNRGYSGYGNGYYGGGYSPYYSGFGLSIGFNPYISGDGGNYYYPNTAYSTNPITYYSTPTTTVLQNSYEGPVSQSSYNPSYAINPTINYATVSIFVPTNDAKVWFGDTPMPEQGLNRLYQSPPLESGKAFRYTIKAKWMENGKENEQTRQLEVRAGQSSIADFRSNASTITPTLIPYSPK